MNFIAARWLNGQFHIRDKAPQSFFLMRAIFDVILTFMDVETHSRKVGERAPLPYDLALISFVFGLASLPFAGLYFCGIMAVAFGWVASRRIRKAGFSRKHRILAIAGIILGLVSIFIGIDQRFGNNRALAKAKLVTTIAHAVALESAVNSFHQEFGTLPVETARVATDQAEGVQMLIRLLGSGSGLSMRSPKFLGLKEGKNRKGGLIHAADGKIEGLFDPWGNPYTLEIDTDYDEILEFKRGGRCETLKGRRVAVYSPGKDGKHGTADDVTTW